jgi:N-acetylglucosamine kinase-like BadF-type ATPase
LDNFYIGIDSGGTYCSILVYGINGSINDKYKVESTHLNTSTLKDFILFLNDAISKSIINSRLNIKVCKGICIGIAGARDSKIREQITKGLSEKIKFKKIFITTDTHIALAGAFGKEDGLVIIAGTGSVLFGKIRNKMLRIGGWGRILGDEGSGYNIGLQALKKIILDYDTRKISKFTNSVEEKFNLSRQNLIEKIYREKFEIQKIAPVVIELAKNKNTDALNIINNSVESIIGLLRIFFEKYKSIKRINLVLSGSLIEKRNVYSEMLKDKIRIKFEDKINITNPIATQEIGAIILAQEMFK